MVLEFNENAWNPLRLLLQNSHDVSNTLSFIEKWFWLPLNDLPLSLLQTLRTAIAIAIATDKFKLRLRSRLWLTSCDCDRDCDRVWNPQPRLRSVGEYDCFTTQTAITIRSGHGLVPTATSAIPRLSHCDRKARPVFFEPCITYISKTMRKIHCLDSSVKHKIYIRKYSINFLW